jgi:hypothetical protein
MDTSATSFEYIKEREMTKDTAGSISHGVTDKSGTTWLLRQLSPMSYAGFRESELGKPARRAWTPAGRIGVLIVASRQTWSESADSWLVADWREHEFMLHEGDRRRARVMDRFLERVTDAVTAGSVEPGGTWVTELAMVGSEPQLGPSLRKE